MKQIIKNTIISLTIFSVYLILSTAFIQPVTAQASNQLESIKKYEKQINTIKKLFTDISNDKEIQTLLTMISNDKELNKELIDIAQQSQTNSKITSTSRSLTSLSNNRVYEDLKNILTTKYGEELNTITEFINILQNNPHDGISLINTFIASNAISLATTNTDPDNSEYLTDFEPEALPLIPPSENTNDQTGLIPIEGGTQSIYGDNGITFETGEATQQIQENNGTSATPAGSAQNILIMHDLNGNIYIHIPHYGWINLPTWFPGFWLIIILLSIFDIIYMVIGWIIYVGIPAIIFGILYTIYFIIAWISSRNT